MAATHPLVAFYRDGARDDEGRTLAEILAWDDDRLEEIHDFIQWLFPLPERSGANRTGCPGFFGPSPRPLPSPIRRV